MSYLTMPKGTTPPNLYYQLPLPGTQGCASPQACKLKVEGKGSITVQPDTAAVVLGVSIENKQLQTAQQENAQKITSILDTLQRFGVPSGDIETQAYIIDPQYDFVEGKQVFRGYRVYHSLKITLRNIEQVGQIIDAAVQSGANFVNSISFSVSNPTRYYQQALRAAVDDAKVKAMTLGDQLKVNVSSVPVQIVEKIFEQAAPAVLALTTAPETTTPVQPGQIEITARVEAVFAYMPF